jgi:hypothetical protein
VVDLNGGGELVIFEMKTKNKKDKKEKK